MNNKKLLISCIYNRAKNHPFNEVRLSDMEMDVLQDLFIMMDDRPES